MTRWTRVISVVRHLRVRIEDGVFQVFKIVIVEVELAFKDAICDPPSALQHGDRLVEHLLKCHALPLTFARAASVLGNQNVISIICSRYLPSADKAAQHLTQLVRGGK